MYGRYHYKLVGFENKRVFSMFNDKVEAATVDGGLGDIYVITEAIRPITQTTWVEVEPEVTDRG